MGRTRALQGLCGERRKNIPNYSHVRERERVTESYRQKQIKRGRVEEREIVERESQRTTQRYREREKEREEAVDEGR